MPSRASARSASGGAQRAGHRYTGRHLPIWCSSGRALDRDDALGPPAAEAGKASRSIATESGGRTGQAEYAADTVQGVAGQSGGAPTDGAGQAEEARAW